MSSAKGIGANEWIGPLAVIVALCLIAGVEWWITMLAMAALTVVALMSLARLIIHREKS